jgi:pilus assembly protein Flp/PilA
MSKRGNPNERRRTMLLTFFLGQLLVKKQKGQGLVEYVLILVLVAVVIIAVLTLLGPEINDIFCRVCAK